MVDHDHQTYAVIGAAMEVHSHLGRGFLEAVYREALCREMEERRIPFRSEVALQVFYKGIPLVTSYRADLICFGDLLVELKALRSLGGPEFAQTLNYMKASRLSRALLLNFGTKSLEHRRVVLTQNRK